MPSWTLVWKRMYIMKLRSQSAVMPLRHVIVSTFVLVTVFTATPTASAQNPQPLPPGTRVQQTAAVTVEAPVFLLPDATRKPLRMLPPGTSLVIVRVQEDWLQVSFNDAQFGRRTGWIERKFVKLNAAQPTSPEPGPPPAQTGAATRKPQPRPIVRRGGVGIRGFGTVTFDKMSASESFKAVIDKDTAIFYGGGVQVTNLWQGLFVEAAAERTSLDGERVFIGPDNEVFRLGIPLNIKMTPVDVVAGWRSVPTSGASAYGAAGVSFLEYEETSDFADAEENVKERYTGLVLLAGIEYSAARFVHIRAEVRYRRFADAIGAGGASAAFDETDLGSFGGALKIAIGR